MAESKSFKCYHCGLDIDDDRDLIEKKIPLAVKGGTRNYRRKFHLDCYVKYRETMEKTEDRAKEQSEWDMVYELFKEQLGVKKCNTLDKHATMRLLGLRLGKYIPQGQNVRGLSRGYSYTTVLATLKFCNGQIKHALSTRDFADQKHRIDYCMKIVTDNINFIDMKVRQAEKTEQSLDILKPQVVETESLPTYNKKSNGGDKKMQNIMAQFEEELNKEEEMESLEDLFI